MTRLMCVFLLGLALISPTDVMATQAGQIIVIVRHAEKMSDVKDPALTEQGRQRAQHLAERLSHVVFTTALTTQFKRTQATLAPIINKQKLNHLIAVAKSPLDDHIQAVAQLARQQSGNVIIAGHSNTVPLIVAALGGPTLPSLPETEFSKLFILSIAPNNEVSFIDAEYH